LSAGSVTVDNAPRRHLDRHEEHDTKALETTQTPHSQSSSVCPAKHLKGRVRRTGKAPYAEGGFSDVWRGELDGEGDSSIEKASLRVVAVKVLRAVMIKDNSAVSRRMLKRLQREVRVWHRLKHPHIAPLRGYAFGCDKKPWLVSPWYENGDVSSYLLKHPSANRKKILIQILDAMIYLHSQGIVHGDLKGRNVLVDSTGDVALCDFGLAKLLDNDPTSFSTSSFGMGTLRWCAPELFRDTDVTHTKETDVWSFACLTLEILTGHIPFHYHDKNGWLMINIPKGAIPERQDYTELPAENKIWDVLEACWRLDPTRRPSMGNLSAAISHDGMFTTGVHPVAEPRGSPCICAGAALSSTT
ncbi:hypothetical protein FRB97_006967, partial [Tulasnella sp. 331]